MNHRAGKHALRTEHLERAVYVDFEGEANHPPVLLGAHCVDDSGVEQFSQFVFHPDLQAAAEASGRTHGGNCVYVPSLEEAIERVCGIATREGRLLVAWSQHELDVVRGSSAPLALKTAFERAYFDAKISAKRWKRLAYPRVVLPKTPRRGRNTLPNFARLLGDPQPRGLAPAAARIRAVAGMLAKRGRYEALTPVVKRKWTMLLLHNEWDCRMTRTVTLAAAR